MHQLYLGVVQQLKTQRDSEAALALWEQVWNAYEENGAQGIVELVEKRAIYPKGGKEEVEL